MKINLKQLLIVSALLLSLLACLKVHANEPAYPAAPDGYIYDGAGLLSSADREKINSLLIQLEQKTTAQVAIATVFTTEPETVDMYAVNLFKKWGIGQKGKDNGVLLLIAKNDRKMRIETGYGLEGALPDAICQSIITNIIRPEFRDSNYSDGIYKGVSAIVSLVAKEYNVAITGEEDSVYNSVQSSPISSRNYGLIILIVCFIIGKSLMRYYIRGNGFYSGGYWYGGGSSGGFGGGLGGGGFGGFGGGGSGGGGSSGGW